MSPTSLINLNVDRLSDVGGAPYGASKQDALQTGAVSAAELLALVRVEASKFGRCCDQYQDSFGSFCCHECGQRTMAMLREVQTLLGIRKDGVAVDCAEETAAAHKAAVATTTKLAAHDDLVHALERTTNKMDEASHRLQNIHLMLARELDDEVSRGRHVLKQLVA